MKKSKEIRRDIISELPLELREHILCSLSSREAIATSCLSSIWRYTWVALNPFDFGSLCFAKFTPNLEICMKKMLPKEVMKNFSIDIPVINSNNRYDYASKVASQWLLFAKASNITDLAYDIGGYKGIDRSRYHTMQNCSPILKFRTLTHLKLSGCYLPTNDDKDEEIDIDLPCLKQIHLDIKVDEKMLHILLGKCGASEKIELSLCTLRCEKVIRIPALSKLKELRVMGGNDINRVEINAISPLQCISLNYVNINKFELVNCCSNSLVTLFISVCGISDDSFSNVSEFPNLETLTLLDCPILKRMKIKSNSLSRFHIVECPKFDQLNLNTPNLCFFEYSSAYPEHNIITVHTECSSIDTAFLHLKRPRGRFAILDNTLWHSKLVALLTNFSQSKRVRLSVNSDKCIIIPQELRESFCPPLCRVQDLSLKVATDLTRSNVLQYLDNLLWLYPNPGKITIYPKKHDLLCLSLELQYEDIHIPQEQGSCGCDLAQPSNFQRHVLLKDFRILDLYGNLLVNDASKKKLLDNALEKWKASTSCGYRYCGQ